MALRNRLRLRNPRAEYFIFWIPALIDSARALVSFATTAVTIPSRWRLIVRATRLTGCKKTAE